MTPSVLFTLGTRGSPLALAQANEARRLLAETHGWEAARIALRTIRTSGDRIQDRSLAEAGGKGLFTKEIDAALLSGEIDAAVHSAKDLPSLMPAGVAIAACLKREDPRDALVSVFAATIEGLPHGATFGAASIRRQAQALSLRPDLKPELLRGNVGTRLKKAEAGEIGATLLALAGLKRLGLAGRARAVLELDKFLPAPGQGAIAITARSADAPALRTLEPVSDAATSAELMAERAFLAEL
jgi:hydroxymethylbilane synthase